MKQIALALVLSLGLSGCASIPVLKPNVAIAVTNGLTALSTSLNIRGLCPTTETVTPCTIISDAQGVISQDATGTTWGAAVRTALNDLYSQLPLSVQNETAIWASLTALEVLLATIGA